MKNQENENQSQVTQVNLEGNSLKKPFDNAKSYQAPEKGGARVITRQTKYLTYYVKQNEQQKPFPDNRPYQEERMPELTAEDVDFDDKTAQEVATLPKENQEEQSSSPSRSSGSSGEKSSSVKYNPEDKALREFAEVLINHLEGIDIQKWERPWIFGQDMSWPRNVDGREYAANNALMLLMHTQQRGYLSPIYATFDRFRKMNFVDGNKNKPLLDDKGEPLPLVRVNKDEKHIPVVKTIYTPVHKQTKEKIPFADYMALSKEERNHYNVYPRNFVYQVFNIEQTNLKDVRPELYAELTKDVSKTLPQLSRDEDMSFPAVDLMINNQLWQCPITVEFRNQACYSLQQDKVFLPSKEQFKYPESFYGTLFHECAHSTGNPQRNGRDMENLDRRKYAREELVAELTAALVANRYGLIKHVKTDSLPYLKAWLDNLREKPQFIKEILHDVRKASTPLIQRIDVIQNRIDELRREGISNLENYPGFIEVNTIADKPYEAPAKYSNNQEADVQEEFKVGRGRR